MIEWMLSQAICREFEAKVGKHQAESGRALHIGFSLRPTRKSDQYDVVHMYLYAPCNYVYVVIQNERIDAKGDRHIGPMTILSYHDSCWNDAVQSYVFKNRDVLNGFNAFTLFDWNDVIALSKEEAAYLDEAEHWRRNRPTGLGVCPIPNPFDKRGIWAGQAGRSVVRLPSPAKAAAALKEIVALKDTTIQDASVMLGHTIDIAQKVLDERT